MSLFNIYILQDEIKLKKIFLELTVLTTKINTLMATFDEVNGKMDGIQSAVDAQQAAVAAGFQALKDQIAALQNAGGATPEQLQTLADKADAIITDIQSTPTA